MDRTVCFVTALFPPSTYGGAENYVLRTAHELADRGNDVSVITTQPYDGVRSLWPRRTTHDGLDIWRFYPLNFSHRSEGTGEGFVEKSLWHQIDMANPYPVAAIESVLSRVEPDVVHTNNLMGISTLVGRTIARHDAVHVHTVHDYSLLSPSRELLVERTTGPEGTERYVLDSTPPIHVKVYSREKRALFGTPDVVTAPSTHILDVHRSYGFFDGVDSRRLRLGVEHVADTPPAVPDEPTVLYVGKHARSKGIETLFETARLRPEVGVHVCGSGPLADWSEARAATLDNVTYHGYVDDAKLRHLRRASSVAVVPSIWLENSPFTIYESFATGLPVIGSDVGGIPELIEPGETGALFDAGDPASLAARIDELTGDPAALERMRANALRWSAQHTIERHVDRLEAVYEHG